MSAKKATKKAAKKTAAPAVTKPVQPTGATPRKVGKARRVTPEKKLAPWQVDYLGVLHSTGRLYTPLELAGELAIDESTARRNLKVLEGRGLVQTNAAGDKYRYAGDRVAPLQKLMHVLRSNGHAPMNLSEIGLQMWGGGQRKDKYDHIKYVAPAGKLLNVAFAMGAVGRMEGGDVKEYFSLG